MCRNKNFLKLGMTNSGELIVNADLKISEPILFRQAEWTQLAGGLLHFFLRKELPI